MPKKKLSPQKVVAQIKKKTGIAFPFTPNPIQMAGWETLPDRGENILVATCASSGKTFFLEMALGLAGGGVYITPNKALCEQKYDEWSKPDHPFSSSIVVKTGDHPYEGTKLLEERRFKLMTPEAFGACVRNLATHKWLAEVPVVAVDEIHHVGSEGRGHKEEAALVDFFMAYRDCRIIGASATLPNAKELGKWLTTLNGRETFVIESAWRPQPLYKHFVPYTHGMGTGYYFINEQEMVNTACEIVSTKPDEKFICFVHTKNAGWRLKKELEQEYGEEPKFHNADLTLQKRKDLEDEFTNGDLRVLIATSTVAAGCNFPARNVIVCGVYRGRNEVEVRDMIQMAERAGRPGFDPKGDAYFVLPSCFMGQWKDKLANPPEIESQINQVASLAFHIIAGIAKERIRNEAHLKEWYAQTFAAHQGHPVTQAQHIIDRLIKAKAVVVDDGVWEATNLGRAAANFYYDPFDILSWYSNFSKLKEHGFTDPLDIPDILAAWAIGNSPWGHTDYITKDCKDFISHVAAMLGDARAQYDFPATMNNCEMGVAAAYVALQDPESEVLWDVPGGVGYVLSSLRGDVERINAAMQYTNKMTKLKMGHILESVLIRMKYGIPHEAVGVCKVKYVGRERGMALLKYGINTPEKILKNKDRVLELFGKIGQRILTDARHICGIKEDFDEGNGGALPMKGKKKKAAKKKAPAKKKAAKKSSKKKAPKKKSIKKKTPKKKATKKKAAKKKAKAKKRG